MIGTLLWLGGLAAVSLIAAVVLRRVGRLAGGTHELGRLQGEVVGISQRLGEAVDPLVALLDDVRRGGQDPATAAEAVRTAQAVLRTLSRQAHGLRAPAPLRGQAQELAWEVDRAVRAADMAGHGLAQMGVRHHDASTEAQTSLKRGTLGLRHAREAVTRQMVWLAKLTPAEVNAMPVTVPGGRFGAIPTPPVDEDLIGGAEES